MQLKSSLVASCFMLAVFSPAREAPDPEAVYHISKRALQGLRTFSAKFERTYADAPDEKAHGLVAFDDRGRRRSDLSAMGDERAVSTRLTEGAETATYRTEEGVLTNATIRLKKNAADRGMVDSVSRCGRWTLEKVVLQGRLTPGPGGMITAQVKERDGSEVRMILDPSHAYLIASSFHRETDGTVIETSNEGWRRFGSVFLPTEIHVKVRYPDGEKDDYRSRYSDIRVNQPVADLLRAPTLPPGARLHDAAEGVFYEIRANGEKMRVGVENNAPRTGSPLKTGLGIGFVVSASLALFIVLRRRTA